MMTISGLCSRLIGDLSQVLRVIKSDSKSHIDGNPICKPQVTSKVDDLMLKALTAVFGMENNDGRIKKEKARRVVEKLGLMHNEDERSNFDLPGLDDEVPVNDVLEGMEETDGLKRDELLREAFKIFDEDGNGYIEAIELKRVLECLGLDKGWEMCDVEKMLKVVDVNLDGKVDFSEFELMMG